MIRCLLLFLVCVSVIVLYFVRALLYVHCSFAIVLMGKRELVAVLSLFSSCLKIVSSS